MPPSPPPVDMPHDGMADFHPRAADGVHLRRLYDGSTTSSTAAQYAVTSATKETTVVTTTTTTISLAPFVLPPPTSLAEKDPRRYPLASAETPHHMKRLRFSLGDQNVTFEEADQESNLMDKFERRQRQIRYAGGSLKHERTLNYPPDERAQQSIPNSTFISLGEAARMVQEQRRLAKYLRARPETEQPQSSSRSRRRLEPSALPNMTPQPTTPDTGTVESRKRRHLMRPPPLFTDVATSSIPADTLHNRAGTPSIADHAGRARTTRDQGESRASVIYAGGQAAATPPIMDSDVEADGNVPVRMSNSQHAAFPTSQKDASLPSPSLSPITAAANLAQRRILGSRSLAEDEDLEGIAGLDDLSASKPIASTQIKTGLGIIGEHTQLRTPTASVGESNAPISRTLFDIPDMINMFDTLPTEMQSYVMYQLLRRSSKSTLKTVADVVNPSLLCDPFDVLPAELSLKITKLLDGSSMGRAAQVSKRWRQLINADEAAWRELLDREDYVLAEGELERAIREGWGWQFPNRHENERDLSARRTSRSLAIPDNAHLFDIVGGDDEGTHDLRGSRKRKMAVASSSTKRQKRKAPIPHDEETKWMHDLQNSQGPISFASAAARAVPDPKVGLSSLKGLHLFKSIYARHRLMRLAWMEGRVEPQHLAFRAHHRHVVTCLLFDADRIITGSDDTSINVFDTKTGILRRRLEGHEGGVWALSCEGNILVSGSTDRSVRVWDINTGKCLQTFQGHTSTVRCLVVLQPTQIGIDERGDPIIAPEEPIIITGSRDSTLRVWKLPPPDAPQIHQAGPPENESDNPYSLRALIGHTNSVRAIAAHGDTLVSGSYDCQVRVWQISTGHCTQRLQGHSQKVYSVVLDHARGRCISGSMDNLVKVWNIETGMCLRNLEGHSSLVGLLELGHGHLVSAAADSTLRVWDPDSGKCRNILEAHTGAITCFQHDAEKVVSGSDRTLKMWNIKTGECVRDLLTDLSGVWQVRFDERRCVAAVQRNGLTYIEVLDFGASRDGVSEVDRGRRIVVDQYGREVDDEEIIAAEQAEQLALGAQQPPPPPQV